MWDEKLKAITFSFDDGVTQDIKAIEILNKYNLKATFNLNSSLLGLKGQLKLNDKIITHNKNKPDEIKYIYKNHEVAVHTLTHPNLTELDESTIIHQVEKDREILSKLCNYQVVGMAYPCGGVNNDERVAQIIKDKTGIKYARTITSTKGFNKQDNLYRFNPSIYYIDKNLFDVVNNFLQSNTNTRQLLYIWGHTYEMDAGLITWENFDNLCKLISNRDDIFYGTNKEVLL